MNKIIEKVNLSENVVKMVLEAPVIAKKRKAGQFIILKINEKGLATGYSGTIGQPYGN